MPDLANREFAEYLPAWLSFLAGLPRSRRKGRVLAVVQAYVDDSGGKGQGEVFLFSALIHASSVWADFSDDWQSCLDESPKIKYFKMDEAAGLTGEFGRFSPPQRDERLRHFCRIICKYKLLELAFICDLQDFGNQWAPRVGRPMCEPYFFPFHMTILAVGYQVLQMGIRQPFEIFFDENVIFGPRAKAWYPVIREIQEDVVKQVMPVEPFFRSDKDVLPLQAADLTAWMQRNHNENTLGEFSWLRNELSGLGLSPFSRILDSYMIDRIASHEYSAEELQRNQRALEVYRETFGHEWPPKTKVQRKKAQGRK